MFTCKPDETSPPPPRRSVDSGTVTKSAVQDKSFVLLLAAVTIFFFWVVEPLVGAVLWSCIAAILFAPLNRRLLDYLPRHRTVVAVMTLVIVMTVVILPIILIATALLQEISSLYAHLQSGAVDLDREFEQAQRLLPLWATDFLNRAGLSDTAVIRANLVSGVVQSFRALASGAMVVGQSALGLTISLGVMLYLSFFLFRDGAAIGRRMESALPLRPELRSALIGRFVGIIHATVKGGLIVAAAQGAAGAFIFWILGIHAPLLWGALMAMLSLLPAVGAALIWLPAAAYLFMSGSIWQGAALLLYGGFVISVVDNILRPYLVGRDTKVPDYIILVTTIGGLKLFGFNGFVLGPMSAAMFLAAWQLYADADREAQ